VLRLDAQHRVGLLGLGWCLSQAGERVEATAVLRRAIEAGWRYETGPDAAIPAGGRGIVEEAARYLVPLLDAERDAAEIAQLRDRIKKLESVPRWITPIVIPLRDGLTALDLVDDDAPLSITSGLQLLGNVTFWAFWQNGYHALRALDDDGDGEVRGAELRGLALWHDRNRNGVSERGEVRPVSAWRIAALSTAYDFDATHPHEIPWSSAGVRFVDGTVRPTFDVVLRRGTPGLWPLDPGLADPDPSCDRPCHTLPIKCGM